MFDFRTTSWFDSRTGVVRFPDWAWSGFRTTLGAVFSTLVTLLDHNPVPVHFEPFARTRPSGYLTGAYSQNQAAIDEPSDRNHSGGSRQPGAMVESAPVASEDSLADLLQADRILDAVKSVRPPCNVAEHLELRTAQIMHQFVEDLIGHLSVRRHFEPSDVGIARATA